MVIEGTIVDVMESWPLQLSIDTARGKHQVDLLEDTKVTSNAESRSPSILLPGVRVRIIGELSEASRRGIYAYAIEIID